MGLGLAIWRPRGRPNCVGFFLLANRRAKCSSQNSRYGNGMDFEFPGSAGGLEALNETHSSSSGDPFAYSRGNASDTIFPTRDNICEDQSSALTDNHTTVIDSSSDPVEAVTCPASGTSLFSTNDITNGCPCISCVWKALRYPRIGYDDPYQCVAGCNHQISASDTQKFQAHFKTHFKQDKKFRCSAPQCGQTFGRWGELTRHNKTHCLRPKKFACDVFGCKYSGDNGFIRHDKLLSHKRNVHDGKAPPSQLMRRLQAKPRA